MILQYNEHMLNDNKLHLIDKQQQKYIREFLNPEISNEATNNILNILEEDIENEDILDMFQIKLDRMAS